MISVCSNEEGRKLNENLTVDDVAEDGGLIRLTESIHSSDSLEFERRRESRFQEEDVLRDGQRQSSTFPLAVEKEDLDERIRFEGSSDGSRVGTSGGDVTDAVLVHSSTKDDL